MKIKFNSQKSAYFIILLGIIVLTAFFAIRCIFQYQTQRTIAASSILKWSIQPSEAYDAITFVNAIDQNNNRYPELRQTWSEKFEDDGIYSIDAARSILPMSRLANILSYTNIQTLDDIIERLKNFDLYQPDILKQLTDDNAPSHMFTDVDTVEQYSAVLQTCFELLKQAGFEKQWAETIQPNVAKKISDIYHSMSKYSLDAMHASLSRLLKTDRIPSGTNVYLLYYNEPLSFMLHKSMVTSYGISSKSLVKVSIHESLHFIPFSDDVLNEFNKQLNTEKAQEQFKYENYGSGKEEYFVNAAEAYISESLGYASYKDCSSYILSHNNGMPFALKVYQLMRKEKPDLKSDWQGYGHWLIQKMQDGSLQFENDNSE